MGIHVDSLFLPKISVIVITRNNIETIEKCITNLLNQNYSKKNFEIIFVDGNSSDGTDDVIKRYCNEKIGCQLFYENCGRMGYARNLGASKSTGDLIAYIDADAFAPSDWLNKIAESFVQSDVVAVGGIDVLVSEGESEKIIDSWRRLKKRYGITAIPCIKTVNFAVKKEVLLSCGGFDQNLSHFDETEFLARMYSKINKGKVIYDPQIVVYHNKTISASMFSRIKKTFKKSRIGIPTLLKRHIINVVIKNPTSSLATSFYLIPLAIVAIPFLLFSFFGGFFPLLLLSSLLVYLGLISFFLIKILKQTTGVTLFLPFLLTVDVISRFSGTFLGLIETFLASIRRKSNQPTDCK